MPMMLHLSNAVLFLVTWIVQVWIYPKLSTPENERFFSYNWYKAFIVVCTLPAMVVQGIGHSFNLFSEPGWIHGVQWFGVVITVLLTFGFAVPLHVRITREGTSDGLVARLIRIHSFRTACWTVIFLLDFIKFRN